MQKAQGCGERGGRKGKEKVRETKEGRDEIILKVQLQLIAIDDNAISSSGREKPSPSVSP